MSLKSDSFPSSAAFDVIHSSLQSDDGGRKDAVKQANAIFAFKLKNKEGQEEAWNIDLKEKGAVTKGEAPEGKKANGESCPCPNRRVYMQGRIFEPTAVERLGP
ncbi:MAG: hypothetical protein LQ350_000038 [Teloschistes chrysophthalmus]|nr:MAG: hypothetical protein LQ350_000038 [Niorma chrysophthalma]